MKSRLHKIAFLIMISFSNIAFSQNLVPNPSFEDAANYPVFDGPVYYSNGWSSYSNTPDYFHVCSIGTNWQIPYNGWGNQTPATGNAYCGFWAYSADAPDGREIIGRKLSDTLSIGGKYFISLKLSLAEVGNTAINKLGVKFLTVPLLFPGIGTVTNSSPPHFYTNMIISDSINWTTISGSFIADSAYQYIMISNFFNDANTDTIDVGGPGGIPSTNNDAYYYVDDICVSIDSNACNQEIQYQVIDFNASDSIINVGACINFFAETITNYTNFQWILLGGNPSISTLQNPTNICYDSSGTYSVTLISSDSIDCIGDTIIKKDYVTVKDTLSGIYRYQIPNTILVYPNPVTEKINIDLNLSNIKATKMEFFNVLGIKIYEQKLFLEKNSLNISTFDSGVYILNFYFSDRTVTRKIVITH